MSACVLAMVASGLGMIMIKVSGGSDIGPMLFISIIWTLFSAVEGWIQFRELSKRFLWVFGGLLTGLIIILLKNQLDDSGLVFVMFSAPALVDFCAALRARMRPWIWLFVTPALYGALPKWTMLLESAKGKVMQFVSTNFLTSVVVPRELVEAAAFFGFILITRAAIGSIIASRPSTLPDGGH